MGSNRLPSRLQAAGGFACLGYAFVGTLIILVVLEPFMFLFRRRERRSNYDGLRDRAVEDCSTIMEKMEV
jgi:hypothetical protein